MRDMERKRAYDRERMARLHAEGKTWWQRQEDLRFYYDQARSIDNYIVALCERSVGIYHQIRDITGDDRYAENGAAQWADRLAEAKCRRRERSRSRFADQLVELAWLPCGHCGNQVVAGYKEHKPTFAIHDRCLRELYLKRQAAMAG